MEPRGESLPTEEPDLAQQHTNTIHPVPQHASNIAPVINPDTPAPAPDAPQKQRISRFISDIRPTPGSNVVRIYGISDCVIAVAFTLFVVNIALPPEGLNTSQLQNFIIHNMLLKIGFFLPAYIVAASSWVSHYRILTYLQRSSSFFIVLNVLFLASIVFLPVPVLFFYQYGNQPGVWKLFAITQMVTSTTLLCMWIVARRALLVPMIFILSIAIILFRNDLAFYFWMLVIILEVADLVYRRVQRRLHKEIQVEADM